MRQPISRAQAILHVVRSRIMLAMGDRSLTPRELSKCLDDVPLGTLYRHLNILLAAGIVEIVGERRVHGTVERTFRIKPGADYLSPEDQRDLSPEELTGIVHMLVTVVTDAFGKFASKSELPYRAGQFSMMAEALYLSADETEELRDFMRTALSKSRHGSRPDTERRIVAFFSVPDLSENLQGGP